MALDRDKITLSVTSPETGTAAEDVPGDYNADQFAIGFNARYLLDILQQMDGDIVELHMADEAAPTLLRENDTSVDPSVRSEERLVGKEGTSTWRTPGGPYS